MALNKQKIVHSAAPQQDSIFPMGNDPVVEHILLATAQCVVRLGPDKTTGDEIAKASGISRATLYRRFENREAIFLAVLHSRSQPFVTPVLTLLSSKKSIARRIEDGMVFALMEMSRDPCLNAFYSTEWALPNLALIQEAYERLFGDTVVPLLRVAHQAGSLRCNVPFDSLMSWNMTQFLQLAAQAPWEREALRYRIRHFVLPVLVPDMP